MELSMTASPEGLSIPGAITSAVRLRRDGRLHDAVALIEASLAEARATPFDMPFRDRVLLGLTLSDLYLLADERDRARSLLATEATFAEQILRLMQETGSPDQVHAASAGCYQVRDRATQVGLLGQAAPEIEVADWVLGQPTGLAEQRGRVVMLEFWATWCRSCSAMFPFFRQLQNRYAGQGLTILALTRYGGGPSLDPIAERARERDLICQTISDQAVEFRVGVAPDGRLQQQYGANGIPTFALIDRTGIVQFASSKPDKAELEKAIVNLLNTTIDSRS
jgi:thiol-disulfide isomerase/thioredoxin